ncbi:MAG TPA: DUF4340 domain-containing protein [Treponemataceae bacterium]|nr:DUF4340 domain-containing protein [Treponemataceae bacterium]
MDTKKLQKLLLILIFLLSIGPIIVFLQGFQEEKKILLLSPKILETADNIVITENTGSKKESLSFIKKDFWYLRAGERQNIEVPVSKQFTEFLRILSEEKKVRLVSKKIKDWEKYRLRDFEADTIEIKNNTSNLAKLYFGMQNAANEIYFRGEKSSVYRGKNPVLFFTKEKTLESQLTSWTDTKWLPSYLGLSRNSIQRLSIEIDNNLKFNTEEQKNKTRILIDKNADTFSSILERLLGSSGALIIDSLEINYLHEESPLVDIRIENEDTKEYRIKIFPFDRAENKTLQANAAQGEHSEKTFLVIPPEANYALEVSRWSIEQLGLEFKSFR